MRTLVKFLDQLIYAVFPRLKEFQSRPTDFHTCRALRIPLTRRRIYVGTLSPSYTMPDDFNSSQISVKSVPI